MPQLITSNNVLLKTTTATKSRFVFDSIDFINIEYVSFIESITEFKLLIENYYPLTSYNGSLQLYNDKSFPNVSSILYEYGPPKVNNLYLNNFFDRYNFKADKNLQFSRSSQKPTLLTNDKNLIDNIDYNNILFSSIFELSNNFDYNNIVSLFAFELSRNIDYNNISSSPSLEISRANDYNNILLSQSLEISRANDYKNILLSQSLEISRANDYKNILLSQALEISRANDYKNILLSQALEISRANDYKNIILSQALEISRANDYKNIILSQALEISRANDYKNIISSPALEISRANDYKNILSSPALEISRANDYKKLKLIYDTSFPNLSYIQYNYLPEFVITKPLTLILNPFNINIMSNEDIGTNNYAFDVLESSDISTSYEIDIIKPSDVGEFYHGGCDIYASDTGYVNSSFDKVIPNSTFSDFKIFYKNTLDIEFNIFPAYVKGGVPTYKHKVFYVDLANVSNSKFFSMDEVSVDDTCYIQDQQYIRTKVVVPDTRIFKYQPLSEKFHQHHEVFTDDTSSVFRSGRYLVVNRYEYSFNNFMVTSHLGALSTKFVNFSHYKPTSIHSIPKHGGSQHAGHDCIGPLKSNVSFNSTNIIYNKYNYNTLNDIIISNNKISKNAWIEKQIVSGVDSDENMIMEFDEIDWELNRNEETRYNFNFEILDQNIYGRLPETLKIENYTITGRLSLNEDFIKKYKLEQWVINNNYLMDNGDINISKDKYTLELHLEKERNPKPFTVFDNIEQHVVDYPNMDNINNINTFKVRFKGNNKTSIIIDIIVPDGISFGDTLSIDTKVYQDYVSGIITKYIGRYSVTIDTGNGSENVIIDRYQVSELSGGVFMSSYTQVTTSYNIEIDNTYGVDVYTKTETSTIPIYFKKYIKLANDMEFLLSSVDFGANRGVVKMLDIYFPIRKNYTYDRDLFLYESENIPDGVSREDWIQSKRDDDHFKFDDDSNNEKIMNAVSNLSEENYMVNLGTDMNHLVSKDIYKSYNKSLISNTDQGALEYAEDISPFIINGVEVTEEVFYSPDTVVGEKRWSRYVRGK